MILAIDRGTTGTRTMLLSLATGDGDWDDELLDFFSAERVLLPSFVGSSGIVAPARRAAKRSISRWSVGAVAPTNYRPVDAPR